VSLISRELLDNGETFEIAQTQTKAQLDHLARENERAQRELHTARRERDEMSTLLDMAHEELVRVRTENENLSSVNSQLRKVREGGETDVVVSELEKALLKSNGRMGALTKELSEVTHMLAEVRSRAAKPETRVDFTVQVSGRSESTEGSFATRSRLPDFTTDFTREGCPTWMAKEGVPHRSPKPNKRLATKGFVRGCLATAATLVAVKSALSFYKPWTP